MPNTVIGLFADLATAQRVERALEEEALFAHDVIFLAAPARTGASDDGSLPGTRAGAGSSCFDRDFVEILVEHGVPRDRAQFYAEGVRAGGAAVILFDLDEEGIAAATRILRQHRPADPGRRLSAHHEAGYAGYAPVAQPFVEGEGPLRFADDHPAEEVGVVYVM